MKIEIPDISENVKNIDKALKRIKAQTRKKVKCRPHKLCAVCEDHDCNGESEQKFKKCHCKCPHTKAIRKRRKSLSSPGRRKRVRAGKRSRQAYTED